MMRAANFLVVCAFACTNVAVVVNSYVPYELDKGKCARVTQTCGTSLPPRFARLRCGRASNAGCCRYRHRLRRAGSSRGPGGRVAVQHVAVGRRGAGAGAVVPRPERHSYLHTRRAERVDNGARVSRAGQRVRRPGHVRREEQSAHVATDSGRSARRRRVPVPV